MNLYWTVPWPQHSLGIGILNSCTGLNVSLCCPSDLIFLLAVIIIIIFINCNWVFTRWQWLMKDSGFNKYVCSLRPCHTQLVDFTVYIMFCNHWHQCNTKLSMSVVLCWGKGHDIYIKETLILKKLQHVLITAALVWLSLCVMSCCMAYEASVFFFCKYILCNPFYYVNRLSLLIGVLCL